MKIAVTDIASLRAEVCAEYLSVRRPALASHFAKAKDQLLFKSRVGAYFLVTALYREAIGEDAPDFCFSADARPAFVGENQPDISLSHDGRFVAAVLADPFDNVGIDLQAEPSEKIAKRVCERFPAVFEEHPGILPFLSPVEVAFYQIEENSLLPAASPPEIPLPRFSLLWTRAEAIRKLKGDPNRFLGDMPHQEAEVFCQSFAFSFGEEIYTLTVVREKRK